MHYPYVYSLAPVSYTHLDVYKRQVKHWPGGGTGEAGRDAHYAYGKYAVYPVSYTHLDGK